MGHRDCMTQMHYMGAITEKHCFFDQISQCPVTFQKARSIHATCAVSDATRTRRVRDAYTTRTRRVHDAYWSSPLSGGRS